jgi:protein-L-isoaspartate(D-aspartate) O-methyltransferase
MRILPLLAIVCLALACGKDPQDVLETLPAGDALAGPTNDLESPEPAVRKTAASALGAMGPQAQPAIPRLLEALRDDEAEVREAAAWALTRIGSSHKALVPFLIPKLRDDSEETQGTAIIGLGRIGPDAEPAVPVLTDLLEDGTPLLQRLAAETLGRIGPRAAAAIPALQAALQRDPGLRKVAADALENIRPDDPLDEEAARKRLDMVNEQLAGRDITDKRILNAMLHVKRHRFVPEEWRDRAYADSPLPIGHGQTISQPYIVALMTQLCRPGKNSRVLEVGTGSGYQAAILAELVEHVDSVEIICPLADAARERLQSLGYDNVEVRCGDGYAGWPEHAPFDVIIVAAAPEQIPQPLLDQLAPGGRLVIPVGKFFLQELIVVEKQADGGVTRRSVAPVAFVPMTREQKRKQHD